MQYSMSILNFNFGSLRPALKPGGQPSRYAVWRFINLVVLGLLAVGAFGTSYFVYLNIYDAYNNTAAIMILNTDTRSDMIDLPIFDKISKMVELKKQQPDLPPGIRNVFVYAAPSAPTSTVSSTIHVSTSTRK